MNGLELLIGLVVIGSLIAGVLFIDFDDDPDRRDVQSFETTMEALGRATRRIR